ncbi:MAG: zf-HC2 domain-containing protein [Clostridia bacterium]|nr:zf-HC2 domain-containing protein [Clostridia bacterium]
MKTPCSVIQDLLPLYAEDLAGEESRALVEAHLQECDACKQTLEGLRDARPMTALTDAVPLLLMKQLLRKHTLLWCLLTGCLIAAMAFTVLGRMTAPEGTPYIKGLFSVAKAEDGRLTVTVTSKSESGVDYLVEYFYNETGSESMSITAYTSPWLRAAKLDRSGTVYTARSKDVRYIYYCDHSRGGKLTLLKGPFTVTNPSGGVLLLPRLTLNYYFLASLALTGLFGVLWLALRGKAAGATLLSVTLGFFSYFLAHLLVKGTDGTSYFLLQDLAFILLTAAALLGIFVSAVSLYRLQK